MASPADVPFHEPAGDDDDRCPGKLDDGTERHAERPTRLLHGPTHPEGEHADHDDEEPHHQSGCRAHWPRDLGRPGIGSLVHMASIPDGRAGRRRVRCRSVAAPLVDADALRRVYLDGVVGVERAAASLTADQWAAPACGEWTATDVARHLVVVVGWYHHWLDRALAGDASVPFARSTLDAHAQAGLDAAPASSGPDAVGRYSREAYRYVERASAVADLPYGYPLGTITVGLHLGVAACEWHLHAWDLSGAGLPARVRHRPLDERVLFLAAGDAIVATERPARRAVSRVGVRVAAGRRAWNRILRESGRRPD